MEVISAWELYLWTRLTGVSVIVALIGACCVVVLIVNSVSNAVIMDCHHSERQEYKNAKAFFSGKTFKRLLVLSVSAAVLFVSIPSKRDMAMIYVIPKIVNNQEVQEGAKQVVGEAKEIYDIAKSALKEYAGVKDTDK